MAISTVPVELPDQSKLHALLATTPYTTNWWTEQTIDNIPEQSLGWLVPQGWNIIDTDVDDDARPPTTMFTLRRQSLNNWNILQSILSSYVTAYNEAKAHNTFRYNDVIEDWTEMIASSRVQMAQQVTEQNAHVTLYLANLDTYMDELDNLVSTNQDTMDAAIASSSTLRGTMQTEFDTHDPAYRAVFGLLEPDYTTHAATARALLTGLGTTDLARINEAWDNALAQQKAQLIDRGISSSAIVTDITTRNTRERNEAIAKLNDGLNREKLQNEHALYGQQVGMRQGVMGGEDRLHALVQEVLRYRQAQAIQDAVAMSQHRSRAIAEKMNVATARLRGLQDKHAENMRLLAYQLDERNKLLIGIYSFVERREDVGPSFQEVAQVAVALGDAGGGWISP